MTTSLAPETQTHPLRQTWLTHPERFKGMRQIDVAKELGVSEGEWVDACQGHESQRLVDQPTKFISLLPSVGEVMVLTRNPSAVHEKVGKFDHIELFERMGMAQVANHDVDLRIFLSHWYRIYAVTVDKNGRAQHSFQVFDTEGKAVHKVFMRPETDQEAWKEVVSTLVNSDTSPFKTQIVPKQSYSDPESIVIEDFQSTWDNMKDSHEFFGLLRRFDLNRIDALRLAGGDRAFRVNYDHFTKLLEKAAEREVPIMVFVANRGCIQIHTGLVHKIACFGTWINVLDEKFNLHLRGDHIAEAWVVKKPTTDGTVTALELYDADGNEIAMLFGERKPGLKELTSWRELISELPLFI